MAIGVHVAGLKFVAVNTLTGAVLSKDDPTVSTNQLLRTRHEYRVIPTSGLPHTANWPDLKTYLTAELPYSLVKLNQSMVLTSNEDPKVAVHVAYIQLMPVDPMGNVLDKSTATIKGMMTANTEPRVIADPDIASSAGNPTVKSYIEAEAAAGFGVRHLDQTMIITYSA